MLFRSPWFCGDPPDRSYDDYLATSHVMSGIISNQLYNWWVSSKNAGGPSLPTYASFTCSLSVCNGGVDAGLRIYQGGVRRVAVQPGSATSHLRIYKDGAIRGVVLVDPTDANASKMRVKTPVGVKSMCLLP